MYIMYSKIDKFEKDCGYGAPNSRGSEENNGITLYVSLSNGPMDHKDLGAFSTYCLTPDFPVHSSADVYPQTVTELASMMKTGLYI